MDERESPPSGVVDAASQQHGVVAGDAPSPPSVVAAADVLHQQQGDATTTTDIVTDETPSPPSVLLTVDDLNHPSDDATVDAPKRRRTQALHNSFAAKKTVAQGMMDVALITANANQLRFVLEYSGDTPSYYLVVGLIAVSLTLQVLVGVSLIFKGRCDLRGMSKLESANLINNYVVVGVFLITVINVFIAAFSTTSPVTIPPPVT